MSTIPNVFRVLTYAGGCMAVALLGLSAARSARLEAQARGAATAQPPAALPQVSVGAIRVVSPGIGDNATELQPFNERSGTTLVIYIKAPAGAGIIDVDDDTSSLKAFTDDKGQNMLEDGDFGSWPKVSKDGLWAMAELGVRGRPSAGATSVTVQGTVAVTVAQGFKPQKIANVRLEVGQSMKVGTTTVTVKELTPETDSTGVTLGLPRAFMSTIKDVHFLTAQGVAIESRRTGSGYMNDAGELSFDVKTKAKVATLEFDLWQNLKALKVPFTVKASIALDK